MKDRRVVLGATLALIGLPVAIVPIEAISFYTTNRDNGSFVSSGEKRDYLLYVPKSYDRSRPTPLVISMHGAGLWGAAQRETSQWNTLADSAGVIVVYPSGIGGKGVRVWRAEAGPDLMKDVRFIAELIDTLRASYNIDSTRIYANGLSNGGGMSFVLSCTLSDRIAAVGMVAAAQTLPWRWCNGARAVPMIAFHGTADPAVPYNGGSSWLTPRPFPSTPRWARIGHEETGAEPTRSNRRSRLTSRVARMRTVRTTRPWCSTLYREEVTPGLAAVLSRNGSSVARLAASMLPV